MHMDEQIYHHPEDYDLEHASPEPDIRLYTRLIRRWQPHRVLELACGNGRVMIPLAKLAKELDFQLTGIDINQDMLADAQNKEKNLPQEIRARLTWVNADMRTWIAVEPQDLILCPCASMSHLLQLQDQLAAWRCAHSSLAARGRFIVAEQMPPFPILAESLQIPPRAILEVDSDTTGELESGRKRLIRYRSTIYHPHEQRAEIRFLYDKFGAEEEESERFLSDYDCHVYFPRELELLFLHSGFEVESVWGDYQEHPLARTSRQLIVVGRKKEA